MGILNTNNNTQQSGPNPTGQWINTHTGETKTVKTMVDDMTGNGAQIMFTDGDVIPFKDFSLYYIQSDNNDITCQPVEINKASEQPKLNENILFRGLTPTVESAISEIEAKTIYNKSIETQNHLNLDNIQNNSVHISKERQMVIDLFNNLETKPIISDFNITISDLPIQPIKVLITYFNVSTDDIVDVIYEKYFNKDKLKNQIKKTIGNI